MSSPLAIASVTWVIKGLLNERLISQDIAGAVGESATVTALPPDRLDLNSAEPNQLNLFMYLATPNPGWRNQDLPSHNARGDRISNPYLALDLHYLLTAYGSDELHHEILLGCGMQLMHENAVLARDTIRAYLAPAMLPDNLPGLGTSGLADQIEQIKISPETLNTEELSRLWTAFGAKYRPNAAYKVTVVLIQSQRSTQAALPVRQRNLYVLPFHQPVIEKISSQAPVPAGAPVVEKQKILPGYKLVLGGMQLKGEFVRVQIGAQEAPAPLVVTDSQIIASLPANLSAGIHVVQVIHDYSMGTPPVAHKGVSSNVQAFMLCPDITLPIAAPTQVVGNGNEPRSARIALSMQPPVHAKQQIVLLLNEIGLPPQAALMAYSFQQEAPLGPTTNITIPVTNVKAGQYLVRVRIDGAESPLGADHATSPTITIP